MKIENLETNKIRITFEVTSERLEEGVKHSYQKNKGKINIAGFRKGKVPRKLIEQQYGEGFFYDDAINYVFPSEYGKIIEENNLEVVSRPEVDVLEISKEKGITFQVDVFVRPEVKIESYTGIQYNKFDKTVKEEDISAEIEKDRNKNSRVVTVTDRAVLEGDILSIDFEGFTDGVAFEGGKGEDYELVIGSRTFIDTFEEQLIGHNIGEEVEVNVVFPEEYHSADLSGKKAMFKVKINEIKMRELPELNDEFAQDVSEFDTLEEYKNNIKEALEARKEQEEAISKESDVIKALVEKAEIEVPDPMIETTIDNMLKDLDRKLNAQGVNLEVYLQYMGKDVKEFRETYRESAGQQVRQRLVLEEIAKREKIEATDEEVDKELGIISETYRVTLEYMKENITEAMEEDLKLDIKVQKALKYALDNAVLAN